MRLGEICALDVADVKEEQGVPFFDITAAKSEAGVRRVPVHSGLIELGFMRYVEAISEGTLWPGITPTGPDKKRSHTFSKRFPDFRRGKKIERDRLSFHSLRKNVVAALEAARVHQSEVAADHRP